MFGRSSIIWPLSQRRCSSHSRSRLGLRDTGAQAARIARDTGTQAAGNCPGYRNPSGQNCPGGRMAGGQILAGYRNPSGQICSGGRMAGPGRRPNCGGIPEPKRPELHGRSDGRRPNFGRIPEPKRPELPKWQIYGNLGRDKKKRSPAVAFVDCVIGCDIRRSGRCM
jgi:hypothetical protein